MGILGSKEGKDKRPSKRSGDAINSKDKAVLDLKRSRDKLNKFQKQMEVQNAKIIEEAKKCVGTGNRAKALTLLKVKKLKEKQIEDINGQLLTVFNMIDRIEWESINVKAMEALKDGTAALNSLHEQMSAEDIEDLLLESQESIEMENKISAQIAASFTDAAGVDDELSAELEALMAAEGGDYVNPSAAAPAPTAGAAKAPAARAAAGTAPQLDLPAVPTVPVLPVAPTGEVVVQPAAGAEAEAREPALLPA